MLRAHDQSLRNVLELEVRELVGQHRLDLHRRERCSSVS